MRDGRPGTRRSLRPRWLAAQRLSANATDFGTSAALTAPSQLVASVVILVRSIVAFLAAHIAWLPIVLPARRTAAGTYRERPFEVGRVQAVRRSRCLAQASWTDRRRLWPTPLMWRRNAVDGWLG
jgi:hypothetical protein